MSAKLTPEMWQDLQLQTQMNPEQGFIITTTCPPDILNVSTFVPHQQIFIPFSNYEHVLYPLDR